MTGEETKNSTALTERQLFGFEYTQYNKDIPQEIQRVGRGEKYSYEIHGKSKTPPEIEMLQFPRSVLQAVVVYYDLDKFLISENNGVNLDLLAITPDGWTQKGVDLTSPEFKAPEICRVFEKYQVVDSVKNECVTRVVSDDDEKTSDLVVKIALWNTLTARFYEEIGSPFDQQGEQVMMQTVQKRREEIFEVLEGITKEDPKELALKSFEL